ncbi:MAG: DNA mismatch repair protein MutS [Bdellovibrionaceae bacterium]|nr:DNA mismatch repair protein MutS [Pseudobdellovibrionaceae bacterium]
MQQYWEIKSAHEDKVLLFRMGDFFEMFHQDAETAAPILNIALTQRNKKSEDNTPMCGVPHHSIAGPIAKLLSAGYKVAICDQIEDPKEAKGIVKRAVTRILSPGMVYDPDSLESYQAHYVCAMSKEQVAFLDTTTGEAFYYLLDKIEDREKIIQILAPKEILLTSQQKEESNTLQKTEELHITVFDDLSYCPKKWESFGEAIQRLVAYLKYMHNDRLLDSIEHFEERTLHKKMHLTPTVIRHLEIFKNYRGGQEGSLYFYLNRCKTSAGSRLLKSWLQLPLFDHGLIEKRLQQVEKWVAESSKLKELRKILAGMGDIERRLGKLSNPNCTPLDMIALADSLQTGILLLPLCDGLPVRAEDVKRAQGIENLIRHTINEEPPAQFKNGGVIKKGFSGELDQLISYAEDSQKLLVEMELRERAATGISSLKIRYNSVFGYYIEVTKTHSQKVPSHYKRKQTLTNAERYLTQELQELEEKVLSARAKRLELEERIFKDLISEVFNELPSLIRLSKVWSELDVFSSLAWTALERNYVKPHFTNDGHLNIQGSRHPVVERSVDIPFVSNDISLENEQCLLLTGPNMAGKSTLMRQVALTSIMAQMGSFVPATQANLPMYECIFTRIGASDFLSEGLSTFMVEMQETAEMLKLASAQSLVILDEVGRGTSTYDGMSLAQAILEHLCSKICCHTLFATHYHELTHLSRKFPKITNAHMSIKEERGEIHFLHTLVSGPANKSYGIQVAKLAGLPDSVTKRAARVLTHLELDPQLASSAQMSLLEVSNEKPEHLSSRDCNRDVDINVDVDVDVDADVEKVETIKPEINKLLEDLKQISVQQMTPLDALNKIASWQQQLTNNKQQTTSNK